MTFEAVPAGVDADELCPRGVCEHCDGAWDTIVAAYALTVISQEPIERSGTNATLGAFTEVGD